MSVKFKSINVKAFTHGKLIEQKMFTSFPKAMAYKRKVFRRVGTTRVITDMKHK